MHAKFWDWNYYHTNRPFDKSAIEQVHITFCKQSLNVPFYTENIA